MSVYFAQVGHYIKVGYSENPERRVKNLMKSATRYGLPADIDASAPRRLLAAIPGGLNEERLCHAALADFAAGCEFFIDEPAVRTFIAAAVASDRVPEPIAREGGPFIPPPTTTPEQEAHVVEVLERLFAPIARAAS